MDKTKSEVSFAGQQSRQHSLKKQTKPYELPYFCDNISSRGKKNLKQILMIQNQPLLKTIYKTPPSVYHTKEVNRSKTCSRAATVKPHRGVGVGLSMTFST